MGDGQRLGKGDDSLALPDDEGSTAEGGFPRGAHLASVYHAPAIFCITNNQWAISSSLIMGTAGGEENDVRLESHRLWPAGTA